MTAAGLLTLLNGGNNIPLFPFTVYCFLLMVHMFICACCLRFQYSTMFFTGTACIKLSSSHPVAFFNCSHRYCSIVIEVLLMCLKFCVIILPDVVTWMMCDYPLWSLPLDSSITLCTRGPLSSHCIATIDPMEKKHKGLKGIIFSISLINVYRF